MLDKLSDINPNLIQDDQIRSMVIVLLNLVESQQKEISELKEIAQQQKDEINRLKGE